MLSSIAASGSTVNDRPASRPALAPSLAPAVDRAAAILDCLAEDSTGAVSLSELARRIDAPKSSVANVCEALVEAGFARRTEGGFALGRRLAELGGAYLRGVSLVGEFEAAVADQPVIADEIAQLAALDGREVIYLARHDGGQPIRLAADIGRRLPASCTALGKAMLAGLDPDDVTERYRGLAELPILTANSERTVSGLLDDLARTRARGYAIDNEETVLGMFCLAMAVPGRWSHGGPYAVSVTLLKTRADEARRTAIVADLERAVERLRDPLAGPSSGPRR